MAAMIFLVGVVGVSPAPVWSGAGDSLCGEPGGWEEEEERHGGVWAETPWNVVVSGGRLSLVVSFNGPRFFVCAFGMACQTIVLDLNSSWKLRICRSRRIGEISIRG